MLRTFLRQSYLAVTDFEFYKDVVEQPFRRTLFFALYFSAVVALLLTFIYAWLYYPEVDRFFNWAEENFPPIEVSEGNLSVKADQPLVTEYSNGATWTFVFDTTGTYLSPDSLQEPVLLFTKDNLFFRAQGQTQTYTWSDFGSFNVNPEDIQDQKSLIAWMYFPFAYSFFLILCLFAKLIQGLLLSPLAHFVGITYGIRFTLTNCFTVALYALVPATVIDVGVRMTGLQISYFDLIYIGIAAIYTYMAAQRCALRNSK